MPDRLRLRPVTLADAPTLLEWVNDAVVRAQSFVSTPVNWPEHLAWLEGKLSSTADAWLWMAETDEHAALGQIRFEGEGPQAVMSFSVAPAFRRQGYGALLVAAGCRRLFEQSSLERVAAYVKPDNLASQRTLARAGLAPGKMMSRRGQPAQVWIQSRRGGA
ncbi:MAG TPA: GNAT family N-acetyltransferase [Pirellulales bacterium]